MGNKKSNKIKKLSYRNKRYEYILIERKGELMQAFSDGYKVIAFKDDKAKVYPSTSKKKSRKTNQPAWFKEFAIMVEKFIVEQKQFNAKQEQFNAKQEQFNQYVLDVFKINNLKQPK